MKFVALTRPDGTMIRFGQGLVIRPAPPHAAERARTEITYSGGTYFVCESPEEVAELFEQLDG